MDNQQKTVGSQSPLLFLNRNVRHEDATKENPLCLFWKN